MDSYLIRSHWHSAHSHWVHAHLPLHLPWHLGHLSHCGSTARPRPAHRVVHHHGSELALVSLLGELLLGIRAGTHEKVNIKQSSSRTVCPSSLEVRTCCVPCCPAASLSCYLTGTRGPPVDSPASLASWRFAEDLPSVPASSVLVDCYPEG